MTFHRLEIPIKFLSALRVRSQPVATAVSPMALSGLGIGHDNARTMPGRCLMMLLQIIRLVVTLEWKMRTNRAWPVEHADTEIPQEKSAIISDTAESIGLLVAAPRIKGHCRYPRVMTLASCNDLALWKRPDRQEIILTTGHDVFAIGGPADTD